MQELVKSDCAKAKDFFMKSSSYFNADLPEYLSFEFILKDVADLLAKNPLKSLSPKAKKFDGVNYKIITNKDGRLSWRALEMIHPVIYVELVNTICDPSNWQEIKDRFDHFRSAGNAVTCCSLPVIASAFRKNAAGQVQKWWKRVEQQSLELSLAYRHLLHTDVTDCYGSLYTHSIAWALHGQDKAKLDRKVSGLLGNKIDSLIRTGRWGQTNGIPQGSVLMDFIAELVLGLVDIQITDRLQSGEQDYTILRYRDDYRIFANSDVRAEEILKCISDALRIVGMKLGAAKTVAATNVVEGAIKPDKLAGIELQQDLGKDQDKAISFQKQLLRLHAFGRRFPNSGALFRLLGDLHKEIVLQKIEPHDLKVQIAIVTDIGRTSPRAFPVTAAILSHLISLADGDRKKGLWKEVQQKIQQVPHNGYLDIWLQRVTGPVDVMFNSDEEICQIVNGKSRPLWNSQWLSGHKNLKAAIDTRRILVGDPKTLPEVMQPNEVELFIKNALYERSG